MCLGKAIGCLAESVEELPLGLCCLWDIEALRVVYLGLGPLGHREPQELPLGKQAQAWPQLNRILVASQGFESLETPARPGPMEKPGSGPGLDLQFGTRWPRFLRWD